MLVHQRVFNLWIDLVNLVRHTFGVLNTIFFFLSATYPLAIKHSNGNPQLATFDDTGSFLSFLLLVSILMVISPWRTPTRVDVPMVFPWDITRGYIPYEDIPTIVDVPIHCYSKSLGLWLGLCRWGVWHRYRGSNSAYSCDAAARAAANMAIMRGDDKWGSSRGWCWGWVRGKDLFTNWWFHGISWGFNAI